MQAHVADVPDAPPHVPYLGVGPSPYTAVATKDTVVATEPAIMHRRTPEAPCFVAGVTLPCASPFCRIKGPVRVVATFRTAPAMVRRPMPMQGHQLQEPADVRDVRTSHKPTDGVSAREGVAQTVAPAGSTTHITDALDAPPHGEAAVACGATAAPQQLYAILALPPNSPIKRAAIITRLFRVRRVWGSVPSVRPAPLRLILTPAAGLHVVHDTGGLCPARWPHEVLHRVAKVSQAMDTPVRPAPLPSARAGRACPVLPPRRDAAVTVATAPALAEIEE